VGEWITNEYGKNYFDNDGSNDVISTSYGTEAGDNQSVTFDPDITVSRRIGHWAL
jgi:hypothetical protein